MNFPRRAPELVSISSDIEIDCVTGQGLSLSVIVIDTKYSEQPGLRDWTPSALLASTYIVIFSSWAQREVIQPFVSCFPMIVEPGPGKVLSAQLQLY